MARILVFGHRNPDNDSVASSVAYAYLMNQVDPENEYVPARLGPMPRESSYIFKRYGVESPTAVTHVRRRVKDSMSSPVITLNVKSTLLDAGRIFRERKFKCIPIVDDDDRFAGVITLHELAGLYVAETDVTGFSGQPVTVGDLIRSFSGTIVVGDPDIELSGDLVIAASEPSDAAAATKPGDIVILGNRVRTQPAVLRAGCGCMIVTCGATPRPEIVDLAREMGSVLLRTDYDTYTTARFASLSQAVSYYMDPGIDICAEDDLLKEAAEKVYSPPHDEAIVLDDDRHVIGILTQGDVARTTKQKVILIDHNEVNQSATGIEDAEIVGIVDHHRVADIQTSLPITFLNLPLGSTATIVALEYRNRHVEIPLSMAAVLLSAIMTDTMLLKSPTTTQVDIEVAQFLGDIIGVDPLKFGIDVIRSRSQGAGVAITDIVAGDAKEFHFGDEVFCIAQYETTDLQDLLASESKILDAMSQISSERGYTTYLLLLTDILGEGSQFVCVGNTHLIERAFNISFEEGSVFMPGILSRKKQVVSRIIEFRS